MTQDKDTPLPEALHAPDGDGYAGSLPELPPPPPSADEERWRARLLQRAGELFASSDVWLDTPHPWLDDRTPRQTLATPDGMQRVETLLNVVDGSGVL